MIVDYSIDDLNDLPEVAAMYHHTQNHNRNLLCHSTCLINLAH